MAKNHSPKFGATSKLSRAMKRLRTQIRARLAVEFVGVGCGHVAAWSRPRRPWLVWRV